VFAAGAGASGAGCEGADRLRFAAGGGVWALLQPRLGSQREVHLQQQNCGDA
jgi:hypothetical protein